MRRGRCFNLDKSRKISRYCEKQLCFIEKRMAERLWLTDSLLL